MRHAVIAGVLCLGMVAAAPSKKEKVLILPFSATDPQSRLSWIGRAIRDDLVTDFSRSQTFVAISPKDAVPAGDEADAIKAAKDLGAKYVIFGSFQDQDANLRITGQIFNTDTEQSIAPLRATGLVKDLFLMEDTLADQSRRVLPHPKAPNPISANAAAESQPQPVIVQPAELDQNLMAGSYSPDQNYARYEYAPPYPYYNPYYWPYASFGYPFGFVPSITVIETHRDHHEHMHVPMPTPFAPMTPNPSRSPMPGAFTPVQPSQPNTPVAFPVPTLGPGKPMPIAPSPIAPHNPQ